MNKVWKDDVYVIEGIDSTYQLAEFYKEVVDSNVEKYLGITSQGRRFKFDGASGKAVALLEDEAYAINPNYRKIEPVQEIPEVVEEPVVEEVVVEEPAVETVEAQPVEDNSVEIVQQKEIEIAQLQECLKNKECELALLAERADVAEREWQTASERIKVLTADLEKAQTTLEEERANKPAVVEEECVDTIDTLIAKFALLGYKVFITKA